MANLKNMSIEQIQELLKENHGAVRVALECLLEAKLLQKDEMIIKDMRDDYNKRRLNRK